MSRVKSEVKIERGWSVRLVENDSLNSVSIFEGLAFIGGIFSLIKAISSLIMSQVNKR